MARGNARPAHADRRRRDAAMDRTRSITRTLAVASAAAVAVFGIYISRAVPGHAATTSGSTASSSAGSTAGGSSSAGSQSSGGLSTPNSPPVQSQQQAPVVSGSS